MDQNNLDINLNNCSPEQLDKIYDDLKLLTYKDTVSFKPHRKQADFMLSSKKGRVLLGGNQCGKSLVGAMEALCHVTGRYPSWYPQHLKMRQPCIGRIIVANFSKGFGEVVLPKLNEWLPESSIRSIKRNHEGYPEKYYLTNGSAFDICTWEQEKDVFEGWVGNWVWFDEPPPRHAYIGSLRGLMAMRGRYWMTMTPLKEPWIYDELVASQEKDVDIFYVDTTDNPYLDPDQIKEFERSLTPEEREARLHGKFLHLTGLVYKSIDPKVHYVNLDLLNKESKYYTQKKNWYFVLDPHDRRPHCAIWAYVDPMNKKYVAYELVREGTITELSAYIRVFERAHGIINPIRIGDPNKLETPSAVNGLKLKDEFAKYGLYFDTKIDDSIIRGHLAVKEELHYDKNKEIDSLNSPRLYFSENVFKVKEMFAKYIYQEWKGALRDSKNPRETPKDVNKDMPDVVRYFIMKRPIYWTEDDSFSNHERSFGRTGYGSY